MVLNQFMKQAEATVRSRRRRTGMMGSDAIFSSTIDEGVPKSSAENGSVVRTRGCVQGTVLPPSLSLEKE